MRNDNVVPAEAGTEVPMQRSKQRCEGRPGATVDAASVLLQLIDTSFHNCVVSAGGASGLKNAESWMCDVVT